MEQAKVTVKGVGEAAAKADHAFIDIDITVVHEDPAFTAQHLEAQSREVEKLLRQLRVRDEAIETTHAGMDDHRRYGRDQYDEPAKVSAHNRMRVEVGNAEAIGVLMKNLPSRAPDARLSGPEWGLSTKVELDRAALRLAAEDARAKAEAHAEALGMKLGPVLQVSDYDGFIAHHDRLGPMDAAADMEPAFRVFEGQIRSEARIEVTFALEPS